MYIKKRGLPPLRKASFLHLSLFCKVYYSLRLHLVVAEEQMQFTTISVRPEVRDEVRRLKRGGESYSALLDRMVAQYTDGDT
jgi:hypothetical protein